MLSCAKRGFTLIELMIVISIIGVLAAILTPNFIRSRAQGQVTACKANLKNIGTALEMYAHDGGGRFPTVITDLTPNYLKMIPTCPSVGYGTYRGGFASASNPDAYTFVCSGDNHAGVGLSTHYPQYNSAQGLIER